MPHRRPRLVARRVIRCVTLLVVVAAPVACDVSLAREDEMGDRYAAALRAELRVVQDTAIAGTLTRMGRRVIRVADATSRDWHFYVVNDTVVNAFAVPGGHIFVNRGLIETAGSYAELSGVLGHEIAHVVLRHSVEQMRAQQKTNVILTLVCSVIDLCGSTAGRVIIGVGGQVLFAKYSRDDEAEADSAAVHYLAAAGIDPAGVPAMFSRLMEQRSETPAAVLAWFGSHPAEEQRVARTRALVDALPSLPEPSAGDDAVFTELRQRLAAVPRD